MREIIRGQIMLDQPGIVHGFSTLDFGQVRPKTDEGEKYD